MNKRRKLFMVLRLYTGLETSLKDDLWAPQGVPTIYKLIEKISSVYDLKVIFTCKDSGSTYSSNWTTRGDQLIKIHGIDSIFFQMGAMMQIPSQAHFHVNAPNS